MLVAEIIGAVDSSWSLLERYNKRKKLKEKEPKEDSIAGRFVQIFENHGILRNQIPRIFDHGLTLHDISSNENLLPKLNSDILKSACDLFAIRLDWLEGVDDVIYKTHNFYKQPEKFADFIKVLKVGENTQLIPRLIITTDSTKDFNAILILEEHLYDLGDSVVRYHLCNNWNHRYGQVRADLTVCIATTLKKVGFMHGFRTNVPIEDFCEGKRFISGMNRLPLVFERNIFFKKIYSPWKPEQWIFDPKSFISNLNEGRFGEANALASWLYYFDQGLMETKYAGENPEPEFRALLDSYQSSNSVKNKSPELVENNKDIEVDFKKSNWFSFKKIFFVGIPLFLGYLSFFGLGSVDDIEEKGRKLFVKNELQLYSINQTTAEEDKNITLSIDEQDKGCEYNKSKKDNRLVLSIKCKGEIGEKINFTVSSKKCPEVRDLGDGQLGAEADFSVKCD